MSDQAQGIRVDAARVDDIRSYGGDTAVTLLFRRTVFSPDNPELSQFVPSACVSLPWELAIGLRELLDKEIARREAAKGPLIGTPVQTAPRPN